MADLTIRLDGGKMIFDPEAREKFHKALRAVFVNECYMLPQKFETLSYSARIGTNGEVLGGSPVTIDGVEYIPRAWPGQKRGWVVWDAAARRWLRSTARPFRSLRSARRAVQRRLP